MWQKVWAKFKSPLLIGYPWFWFDFFILEKLIMITLDMWVPFYIISMNFILFIFLYLRNTWKTAIMTSIQGHGSVQTPNIYHNLVWGDFSYFYKLYSSSTILGWDVNQTYPTLIEFLFSWVEYKEDENIPLVRTRPIPPTS
jgi:hypothetical protein